MRCVASKIIFLYCMLFALPGLAVATDDEEIIFDDEEGENKKPGDKEDEEEPPAKPAPVEQVVEHTTDEQGLLRNMDEYDSHLPYEKMRKDIPKFHIDAAAAAEYVLQVTGSTEQPRADKHLGELVEKTKCAISFDLVKELTPQG